MGSVHEKDPGNMGIGFVPPLRSLRAAPTLRTRVRESMINSLSSQVMYALYPEPRIEYCYSLVLRLYARRERWVILLPHLF